MQLSKRPLSRATLCLGATVVAILFLRDAPVAAQSTPSNARFANISVRAWVSANKDVLPSPNLISTGFEVSGPTPKTFVVRAMGPSLTAFGVSGTLADPMLRIFRSGEFPLAVATNDDWQAGASAAAILALGYAPTDPRESAVLVTLQPGVYFADVSGQSGVALLEIFEVDSAAGRVIRLAGRGRVRTGDEVMIAGFVIAGTTPMNVLIRVRGPSLQQSSSGTLTDPNVRLVRSSDGVLLTLNDNWGDGINAYQINARGFAPTDPREPAILFTLSPGAYTAIAAGTGGTVGDALIEVFELP